MLLGVVALFKVAGAEIVALVLVPVVGVADGKSMWSRELDAEDEDELRARLGGSGIDGGGIMAR